MVSEIIIGLLLVIAVFIALMDIAPIFKDWLSRIHIGRYTEMETWNQSVTNKAVNWLNNTPKIKMTDNVRFTVIDRLRGNYSKNVIQHWQEASLLLGLTENLRSHKNKEVQQEIIKFLHSKFDDNGRWKEKPDLIDSAILAYAVLKVDFVDTDKFREAFDDIWNLIKAHVGEDGTAGYRKSMMTYRYVDTIGFICPFLVNYGLRYNKDECVQLAVKQIKQYEKYGMLQGLHIPCHAYNTETSAPVGLYGWGRGLGWFALGLIDTWNEFPDDHPYKEELTVSIKRFAEACRETQQMNGAWNWIVTRNEARPDSSATAVLGWYLSSAAKIDGNTIKFLKSADKSLDYLMKVTRRNGEIDFSQGDTKDIGVYSILFNKLPFTQGFSIRLYNSFVTNNRQKV